MLDKRRVFASAIGVALEHIRAHGSLQGFAANRQEKLVLMKAATEQGLIVWNKAHLKYDLTAFGSRRLADQGAGASA
jgi:hypothetical protein